MSQAKPQGGLRAPCTMIFEKKQYILQRGLLFGKNVWFARSLLHLELLGAVFALLCWLCPIRKVISILWTAGVSRLFLFSSFPCVCQVLCTCQSFHALLVLIGFLLTAALGQTLCSAQQLFRKRKMLKIFLPEAEISTLLGRICPLVPPSLFESSQQ